MLLKLLALLPLLASCLTVTDLRVNYLASSPQAPITGIVSPTFSWQLFDSTRGQEQASYQITVAQGGKVVWDSQAVQSNRNFGVVYAGPALTSDTVYMWNVTVTAASASATATNSFVTALYNPQSEFQGTWITGGDAARQLRRQFTVPAGVVRATVHVSGIGYYILNLNGMKVGNRQLDVGWTDYSARVYYTSYDISQQVKVNSDNVFGVTLGNGWFACAGGQPGCVNNPPQLLLQANFYDASGKVIQTVSSDMKWKVAAGPIFYDSLYNGESYDARAETPGWDSAGFDDSKWAFAIQAQSVANKAIVSPATFEPIRHLTPFVPISITEVSLDKIVIDFGQNMAAVVRLRIRAGRAIGGKNVTIRHAEVLQHPPYGPEDGNIYVGNLRSARATDLYVMKGDQTGEVYTPSFTQHGFRFVEISGLGYLPTVDEIVALEMHSDIEEAGNIAFSSATELLNKIHHNVQWGQKSNLMSVPSDCPQRDERRGWMGDAGLTAEEALYNFKLGAFYTSWLDLVHDDQLANGAVPNFVPSLGSGAGAPNWQTAYPTLIHEMFITYGDTQIIQRHWSFLAKYQMYWDGNYNATGLKNLITGFGDWVPPPPFPQADLHLTAAFAYVRDKMLFIDMANAIGDTATAQRLQKALDSLRAEFHTAFFNTASGFYGSGLQTEQAFGLWLNAPPSQDVYDKVLAYFINDIMVTQKVHPTTGIIGWKYMLEVLSLNGRSDVGIALNLQTTYPSFGYMIQGEGNAEPATTVWELWDSDKEGPSMNSRNHIMFGTNGAWFYHSLAGIQKHGLLAPLVIQPSGINSNGLASVAASALTAYGPVDVSWSVFSGVLCSVVPENAALSFSCIQGNIQSVSFASFGTVQGSCPTLTAGSCNSPKSLDIVSQACVGQSQCSVQATDAVFGDPCNGTVKVLGAVAQCGSGAGGYFVSVTLPVGPASQVVLGPVDSLGQKLDSFVIMEGGEAVWKAGQFLPGVSGIKGGVVSGSNVQLTVLSGSYSFAIYA